ncbi:(2Fe-2S)-binding protein [Heliobacillus mobilis]|uniref:Bacterioferritin-associated ferredoxin n=1 Tax=Heliobacterium mobile TaxID=28064 RepID=A0A6I3SPE5_HELMO|nr:(2Fe-2S)-binding protein [Heliobacterium mobile]
MKADDIVCGCNNVTYEDLENAIANGAKSFEKVQEVTKAGTGCGGCTDTVKSLVNKMLSK